MSEAGERALYGIIGEYGNSDSLVRAANAVYDAGYRSIDAYSPFPVHGLPEALGFEDPRLQWMIFMGGVTGGCLGFVLQWWICAAAYAHNVGGRPYFSWPAFIPVTFECTVLCAALTAVFGMLGLNKLPQPHHPMFDVPNFDRASQDAFFLTIEAKDEQFDADAIRRILEETGAINISMVSKDEEADW